MERQKDQRDISTEQILYLLINLREEEAKRDINTDIIVNKEACRAIGMFNYKLKDTGKQRAGQLFLISETHDGKQVNIIYDDKGRFIGWENVEKTKQKDREIQISQDIELNEQQLRRQIELEEERTKNTETSSSDTTKAGEGRDLPKEKKQEEKINDKKEKYENLEIKSNDNSLKNLKNDINIDDKPKIRLDEIINGYYLWEILQIEDKLKGKLPEGISEKTFRNGYLTILDSKELEAKDNKPRKAEDTFAICTFSGDIIELDEQILEPKDLGTMQERKQAEQNRLRFADGEESEKPDTEIDLTRTSLYKIPNVNEKFGVAENWFLGVDQNRKWMENGDRPVAGNKKEITFVQASREDSYYNSEERVQNTLEYKLEPINEVDNADKKELEQREQLKNKDASEVLNVRREHTQELVDECYKKYQNLRKLL